MDSLQCYMVRLFGNWNKTNFSLCLVEGLELFDSGRDFPFEDSKWLVSNVMREFMRITKTNPNQTVQRKVPLPPDEEEDSDEKKDEDEEMEDGFGFGSGRFRKKRRRKKVSKKRRVCSQKRFFNVVEAFLVV